MSLTVSTGKPLEGAQRSFTSRCGSLARPHRAANSVAIKDVCAAGRLSQPANQQQLPQRSRRRTACRRPAAGSSGSSSRASSASSDLMTFAEVQEIAQTRGLELSVQSLGLSYRIVCRDPSQPCASSVRGSSTLAREADEAAAGVGGTGRVLAVTSGFLVPPPLGIMHCDMLQVFTRGQKGEEGARTRGGVLGLGLLMGAATFAFGAAAGCRKAEILAINDNEAWHDRLVGYYRRFGFQPVRVVRGGSLADLPHMVVWGGAGTRMDADVLSMLRRWMPAVRRNSAAAAAGAVAGGGGRAAGEGVAAAGGARAAAAVEQQAADVNS